MAPGDKQTLIDIKTRYDGAAAQNAQRDMTAINQQGSAAAKQAAKDIEQVAAKTKTLTASTADAAKGSQNLNVIMATARGNFAEAGAQLTKLTGGMKVLGSLSVGMLAGIGLLVAAVGKLTQMWRDHRDALEKSKQEMEALKKVRLDEVLDLKLAAKKAELDAFIEQLKMVGVEAQKSSRMLLAMSAARTDRDLAEIDLAEALGRMSPQEANRARQELAYSRDANRLNTEERQAKSLISSGRTEIAEAERRISTANESAASSKKQFDNAISSLRKMGGNDDLIQDLTALRNLGGEMTPEIQQRITSSVEASMEAEAKRRLPAQIAIEKSRMPLGMMPDQAAQQAADIKVRASVSSDFRAFMPYMQSMAGDTGKADRTSRDLKSSLQPVLAEKSAAVEEAQLQLGLLAEQRGALELRRRASFVQSMPDADTVGMSPSAARVRLIQGMAAQGRYDNTGQMVAGSPQAQIDRAVELIDIAQGKVMGGEDANMVAEQLAAKITQLRVRITNDRETFRALVDQLDGVINAVQEVKARTRANQAGD